MYTHKYNGNRGIGAFEVEREVVFHGRHHDGAAACPRDGLYKCIGNQYLSSIYAGNYHLLNVGNHYSHRTGAAACPRDGLTTL